LSDEEARSVGMNAARVITTSLEASFFVHLLRITRADRGAALKKLESPQTGCNKA